MNTANYKCKCGNIITVEKKYGKDFTVTKKCDVCKKRAKRIYSEINLQTPYHMKSTTA